MLSVKESGAKMRTTPRGLGSGPFSSLTGVTLSHDIALATLRNWVSLPGSEDKTIAPPLRGGGRAYDTHRCGSDRKSRRELAGVHSEAGNSLSRVGSSAQRSGAF